MMLTFGGGVGRKLQPLSQPQICGLGDEHTAGQDDGAWKDVVRGSTGFGHPTPHRPDRKTLITLVLQVS